MLIAVLNSLMSYLLLVLVIVVVGAAGVFIGIRLRKSKDHKEEAERAGTSEEVEK